MQGNYLNGDYTEFYERLQEEWGFKYLPGKVVEVNTNKGPRKVRIEGVYEISGVKCYNGLFMNNGDGCFMDIPISVIDNCLLVEIPQYD